MKLLREKYKTLEGATKRAAFENAVAPGEFARGEKSKLYTYRVALVGEAWRVERRVAIKQEA
jgi:hypothetical protein